MKLKKKFTSIALSLIIATGSILPVLAAESLTVYQGYRAYPEDLVYTINNIKDKSYLTCGEDLYWTNLEEGDTYSTDYVADYENMIPVYEVSPGSIITLHNANILGLYAVERYGDYVYVSYDDVYDVNPNLYTYVRAETSPIDEYIPKYTGDLIIDKEGYYIFYAYILNEAYEYERGTTEIILHVTKDSATTPAKTSFTDVRPTDYFYTPVNWAIENKITAGTSKTTFSPDDLCTNAQIITYLWIANGSPEPTIYSPFPDVLDRAYYCDAAIWAYQMGIVTRDYFYPDRPCSRLSSIKYMWLAKGAPIVEHQYTPFKDIRSEDVQPIAWALQNNITSGTSATTFSPEETCSRGQIMTFLYNDYAK